MFLVEPRNSQRRQSGRRRQQQPSERGEQLEGRERRKHELRGFFDRFPILFVFVRNAAGTSRALHDKGKRDSR